jgi:hypothetical protein
MFFISCRCCSIGLEQVNSRAETQGGPLRAFSRSSSRKCPTLLPGQMTDFREALRRWHYFLCVCGEKAPCGPNPPHYRGFKIILRHTTIDRTPLDEWLVRRRDLYLTTHTTQNRQTSVSPVGFEPATLASEWPQTHALDGTASWIGRWYYIASKIAYFFKSVNQVIVIQYSWVRNFCWGVATGKQNTLT